MVFSRTQSHKGTAHGVRIGRGRQDLGGQEELVTAVPATMGVTPR